MLNKQIERIKNNGHIFWTFWGICALGWLVYAWSVILPLAAELQSEPTVQDNLSIIEAITTDEVKWKTITVETFNPKEASDDFTDSGLTKKVTTEFYFDQRVPAKKERK